MATEIKRALKTNDFVHPVISTPEQNFTTRIKRQKRAHVPHLHMHPHIENHRPSCTLHIIFSLTTTTTHSKERERSDIITRNHNLSLGLTFCHRAQNRASRKKLNLQFCLFGFVCLSDYDERYEYLFSGCTSTSTLMTALFYLIMYLDN